MLNCRTRFQEIVLWRKAEIPPRKPLAEQALNGSHSEQVNSKNGEDRPEETLSNNNQTKLPVDDDGSEPQIAVDADGASATEVS